MIRMLLGDDRNPALRPAGLAAGAAAGAAAERGSRS